MSEAAQTGNPPGTDPASAQNASIPKYRFDEVSAQLRAAREQAEIQQQLLNNLTRNQPPQEIKLEELGIEPQHAKAVEMIVQHRLKQAETQIQGAFANMNNQLDETRFLLNQGKDKTKFIPQVREQQKKHYQMTGGFQSMEDAYKLIRHDEMEAEIARLQARNQAVQTAQTTGAQTQTQVMDSGQVGGVPDAAQTRQTTVTTGSAKKTIAEMTLEEAEAYLDQIGGGQTI